MVESGLVPGKGRIRGSIKKLSGGVPEKGPIIVSTEKWKNPGQYREKVDSVRVSKNCHREYQKRLESVWLLKNGIIRVSTGKRKNLCECRKTVPGSTGKWLNLWEYRKMVESGRVPGKARIGTSIENLSRRVPENGRICVSIEKLSRRVPEKGRICVSTEKL